MTTAIIAALYYGGNHQNACCMLKINGYIPNMLGHSRYNRRLHNVSRLFETLFATLAQRSKHNYTIEIYAIDTYPVFLCDNIRISRQGKQLRGRIASKHRYFYGLKIHLWSPKPDIS